jgi:cold shock CspA family protein
MQIPPEIVFRGVDRTSYLDIINKEIAKLEKVCDSITSTRVAVESSQNRHQVGNTFRVRIDVRIPDHREIKVERSSAALKKTSARLAQMETETALEEESGPGTGKILGRGPARKGGLKEMALPELIRRTFDSARREVQQLTEKQAGDVKVPAQQQSLAVVEKLFEDDDYGFLRTMDGRQLYFNKNSVLHNHWAHMTVGAAVRFSEELGKKGPQATTVEMVSKPGAAESHGELHELPTTAATRR